MKTRVDLFGVLKKKKKAPIFPRMLQFMVDATSTINLARAEVAGRAMLIAWECHFRRATITVAWSIITAGRFHPSWHLTLGDINYRRLNGAVISPVPELLRPLRNHLDWYMTVDPSPEKGDSSGQRHSHSPAICPPIEGMRCAALTQLEKDISVPVTDPGERASTPLLIDPVLERALSTEVWRTLCWLRSYSSWNRRQRHVRALPIRNAPSCAAASRSLAQHGHPGVLQSDDQ